MARDRDIIVLDVEHLVSLHGQQRLQLRPDFQRNAVWPVAAKSYLIDTIIHDRPVPLLFLQPFTSPQSGLPGYSIVDGQQRLTAIFDYVADRYRLSGPEVTENKPRRFSALSKTVQRQILSYGLVAEVLHGYSAPEIREVFVRLNKYGVRLSPQELRHARGAGAFRDVVEGLGARDFWVAEGFVSAGQDRRMRTDELAAELLILLAEAGPQDKKAAIDEYYVVFEDKFPDGPELVHKLDSYIEWVRDVFGDNRRTRFRKPVDLYALIGALDRVSGQGERLSEVDVISARKDLERFELELNPSSPSQRGSRYLLAASRQTDNINPRRTRIEILVTVLEGADE